MINKLKNKINSDIHLKELLKGSSIAFVLRIVGIIAGYIFTLLITRGYGAETMGVFALSFTLLQISSVIGRLGMDTALLRFVAEYSSQGKWEIVKDIYKKAIRLVIPFSLFLSVLVFFLSPYIAEYLFRKPHLAPYFQIASLGIAPFVLLFIHTESLRGLKKIKEYMFIQQTGIFILASTLLALIIFLLTNNLPTPINDKPTNTNDSLTPSPTLSLFSQMPIITYIFSVFIFSTIAYLIWKKTLNHFTNPSINKLTNNSPILYSTILNVSLPMLFSSSLILLMGWTDTIMLGIFRTEEEVGIYNVAYKMAMITSVTLTAINTISAPKFAEFWGKGDIKGLAKVAQQSTKLIFWTSFPILLLFLIFPKPILSIFGEEFKVGAIALMILTIGQFINAIFGSVGYILQMTGKQIIVKNFLVVSLVTNICLNFVFIPSYGYLGAAVSSVVSTIIWNILSWIFIRKTYNINTISIKLSS